MPNDRSPHERQRGSALPALALIAAVVFGLASIGLMLGVMAWWGGDHFGMMRRGSAGADQTPVVSEQKRVTVEMRDYEFFPAKLTVNAGTELTWVNRDNVPHNAVAEDGAFDTGTVDSDEIAFAALDRPGVYSYVCTFHPGMEATVTVR